MTPAPAAPPKQGNALAQLEELEREHADAKALADRLSRDHFSKVNRFRELHDERRRLIHNDPTLVDHLEKPVATKGNGVADVDRELAGLPDLEDLGLQVAHKRKLLEQVQQHIGTFVRENHAAVVADLEQSATAEAASANTAIQEAHRAVNAYVGYNHRVAGILAAGGLNTRVAGLDPAADLARTLEGFELPVPLPEQR